MSFLFHKFLEDISIFSIPERLNFPFYYEKHPLAEQAVKEMQENLIAKTKFTHDFGIENPKKEGSFGKMFGVLVVQNLDGELGYLAGFSGKIGDTSHYEGFVPPVFDMLGNESYFRSEEEKVNALHLKIEALENS
ncbi:MAG: RNA pseudouridine synthase, partial [Crocinitomicaceae bacterium]|nr:RNA pseudouridine synthase [Crocinitomicaceae bacterium]